MLTDELMAKVKQLEIATRRRVDEVFAGEYSSAFRGRGMEFDEVRAYTPGDDVRTIDWNVTARTGEPFVKRFVEERELTIILAVDLSASGAFGSIEREKRDTAAELCAVLALAAVRSSDKVGLIAFTDRVERHVTPRKGSKHVLRILREVLDTSASGTGTDLAGALEEIMRVQKRRAVVFLVSDFLSEEVLSNGPARDRFETALRVAGRRHDLVAVAIGDPRERELPNAGLIELKDAETGGRMVIDSGSSKVRTWWAGEARRREKDLETLARRSGVDIVRVETGEEYILKLMQLFRAREKRR